MLDDRLDEQGPSIIVTHLCYNSTHISNTITRMSRTLSIGVGIFLVICIAGLVFWQKNAASPESAVDVATTTASGSLGATTSPVKAEIGATEVATHASRESCWSIINGNVYDLTSWIPKHPGGEEAILRLCGTDGSAKFNGQHGGAPKQAAILAGFKIGVAAR